MGSKAGAAGFSFETEVAARILVEAMAEEMRERDIVEAAAREDSVLDEDTV